MTEHDTTRDADATKELMAMEGYAPIVDYHVPGRIDPQTVEIARERLEIFERLKRLAIGYTSPADWVLLSGKPYLTESGCMKFAEVYGVSFQSSRVEQVNYSDERGPVIMFVAVVTAEFRGRKVEEEGSASTAGQFFNGSEETEGGKKRAKRLPLSEIDIPNVRKKAITNAKARATKKILGLSFTREEMDAALSGAGKAAAAVSQVSYGGKSEVRQATGKGKVNDTKRRIGEMILEMCDGDKVMAGNLLEGYTEFQGRDGNMVRGKRSVADLTDRQAEVVIKKVEEEYKKFLAETTPPTDGGAL